MSEVLWTSEEVAKATGGTALGDWAVSGLSIDTRTLSAGDLFVPLKDQRDGHEFIPQARTEEAGAIMSERPDELAPALIVQDTQMALNQLGQAGRDRSDAIRFGVTGSVGKTSVKELIATICSSAGRTHKSVKSYNNHWGVPLTLARMPKRTQFGVFEMGMNHAEELSALSSIVKPHIAIITRIAAAHLAHFDSVDAIAAAKGEIFDGCAEGARAILNRDDVYFDYLSQKASSLGLKVASFGYDERADFQISDVQQDIGSLSALIRVKAQTYKVSLRQTGRHWIENACCAIVATVQAGISISDAIEALKTVTALPGRGDIFETRLKGRHISIMDESYNANPASMTAAISALGQSSGKRKIAVLGDMFELGKDELELHASLSEPIKNNNIDRVIFVGECMRSLRGALPRPVRGPWVKNWDQAFDALQGEVSEGDMILIKGSNGTGLWRLVAKIKQSTKENAHVL